MTRAVSLDPEYIPAAAGLIISRVERGDLRKAHQDAERLVRRRPDTVDAHFSLSYVLRFAGLLKESAKHCETGLLLDAQTQTSGLRSCAIVHILLGDYPRALNYLQLDLGSQWAKVFSIEMLVREGKENEALRIGPSRVPQWNSSDLLVACVEGKPAAEIAALMAAVRPSEDPEWNYFAAAHLSFCGQTKAAAEMVMQAINGGYCSYPAIEADPLFTSLRGKPQFGQIRSAAVACQDRFLARNH